MEAPKGSQRGFSSPSPTSSSPPMRELTGWPGQAGWGPFFPRRGITGWIRGFGWPRSLRQEPLRSVRHFWGGNRGGLGPGWWQHPWSTPFSDHTTSEGGAGKWHLLTLYYVPTWGLLPITHGGYHYLRVTDGRNRFQNARSTSTVIWGRRDGTEIQIQGSHLSAGKGGVAPHHGHFLSL